MRENKDQNNSEYEHFSRSDYDQYILQYTTSMNAGTKLLLFLKLMVFLSLSIPNFYMFMNISILV